MKNYSTLIIIFSISFDSAKTRNNYKTRNSMLENFIKELEKNKTVSVPIDADNEGYYDRKCPSNECQFQFKVHEDDLKNISKDEQVFCPMCRHEANADSWWTTQQLQNSEDQATKYIEGLIDNVLKESAREFNSSQSRNSFIRMSMSVSGTSPHYYILPVPAEQEMLLKITCKECNSRYAVVGSAFFCPSCGHNSAEETFDNSLNKIEAKLKNLPVIRKAVEEISMDEAEITCRSLIETSLNECVVAFQRFCEVTFTKLNPSIKVKFNAFQKLDVGGESWKDVYGESYSDWLTQSEYAKLNELFQKRHLLSHTEGIVDQKYIDKSGDTIYSAGQRIVIKEKDVITLKDLVKKVVTSIRQKVSG